MSSWTCNKHPTVSKSSAQADFRSMTSPHSLVTWLLPLLQELRSNRSSTCASLLWQHCCSLHCRKSCLSWVNQTYVILFAKSIPMESFFLGTYLLPSILLICSLSPLRIIFWVFIQKKKMKRGCYHLLSPCHMRWIVIIMILCEEPGCMCKPPPSA